MSLVGRLRRSQLYRQRPLPQYRTTSTARPLVALDLLTSGSQPETRCSSHHPSIVRAAVDAYRPLATHNCTAALRTLQRLYTTQRDAEHQLARKDAEEEGIDAIANGGVVSATPHFSSDPTSDDQLEILPMLADAEEKRYRNIRYLVFSQQQVSQILKHSQALLGGSMESYCQGLRDNLKRSQWNSIATVLGLCRFKQLFGHLLVPQRYIVPEADDQWPAFLRKLRLGQNIHTLRKAKRNDKLAGEVEEALDSLGFVWNVSDAHFELLCDGIVKYKEIHGNLKIPFAYVVPEDSRWPKRLHGMHLGRTFYSVENNDSYIGTCSDRRERIIKLTGKEFSHSSRRPKQLGLFDKFVESYQHFAALNGTTKSLPPAFRVPSTSDWPIELHGFQLGKYVHLVESGGKWANNPKKRKILAEIGVTLPIEISLAERQRKTPSLPTVDSSYSARSFEKIVEGLKIYREIFGTTRIKATFIVPDDDERWPKELRGMKLGLRYANMKHHRQWIYDREKRATIVALGFEV